jgi:hypothetical protein
MIDRRLISFLCFINVLFGPKELYSISVIFKLDMCTLMRVKRVRVNFCSPALEHLDPLFQRKFSLDIVFSTFALQLLPLQSEARAGHKCTNIIHHPTRLIDIKVSE